MNSLGMVFPGQGSQYIGMGQDLYNTSEAARRIFTEAGDILDRDMAALCFEGPREALDTTTNTQVAILTVSIAVLKALEDEIDLRPVAMAGHSLGEYSALCAADALSLADALRIVRARAGHQQEAVPPGVGCMTAIMGLDEASVTSVCREINGKDGMVVEMANVNSPSQYVISGHTEAVEKAVEHAKDRGAKRGIKLPVSVPFHCSLLTGAAEKFKQDLGAIEISDCTTAVIPNCDPSREHRSDTTRELLERQLYSPVRWQETIERMARMGITTIVEVGPKRVLSGLIKRIDSTIEVMNVEDTDSLREAVQALGS